MTRSKTAVLALEDGTIFHGRAFGAKKTAGGECVFNTSMTGYEEIITDPSYYMQIVTLTTSQVGNYGITQNDGESETPKISALVVRELSPMVSNWRAKEPLSDYLARHGVPGIVGINTRFLTKLIRNKGTMNACLSTAGISDEKALQLARSQKGPADSDYVAAMTTKTAYHFEPGKSEGGLFAVPGTTLPQREHRQVFRLAAIDFGAKRSIFRQLHHHGFDVFVLPATSTAEDVLAIKPDALFLSNGPGDPATIHYAHAMVAACIGKLPIFGICLGHQIIAKAIGAETYKLKFGHRGGNHPVKNLVDNVILITSQNHGYAVTADSLERLGARITEIHLNDNTVSGFCLPGKDVFCVQYHPEAGPGPHEGSRNFEKFYQMVTCRKKNEARSLTSR
ncbi:MAG: glutamine-hydrolyzing carbamoyl-phosphate synthase small subunit [Phycisphaerales bacterium]|nr:glutamine-hydrolyzing carbamoyl-phosphate synthase small subunit [Phycisphaerales bacterium]